MFVPIVTTSPPPSKYKTTAVDLYFDPHGTVSVVDVLVQEGMRMDYTRPLHPLQDSGYSEAFESSENNQTTRRRKQGNFLNLSTVSGNGFESCEKIQNEESLSDSEDTLIQPNSSYGSSSGADADFCEAGGVTNGHMTTPDVLIGQKETSISCTGYESGEIGGGANQSPLSHWQQFQDFCDELSL